MQFKPSEPHLVPYLVDVKGFSTRAVNSEILPVSLYASLCFFLLAGPLASVTSTKTVLVLGAGCKLCTRGLLLWGNTKSDMALMQVTFAAGAASDLMVYAYLAAMSGAEGEGGGEELRDAGSAGTGSAWGDGQTLTDVQAEGQTTNSQNSESQLRYATGAVSASSLLGYMFAAELGQALFDTGVAYVSLFWISAVAVGCGFIGILWLPGDRPNNRGNQFGSGITQKRVLLRPSQLVTKIAKTCYGSSACVVLSFWWAVGTPPTQVLETYVISVLNAIDSTSDVGGHVVFFTRGISAVCSLCAARASKRVAQAPETYIGASVVACVSSAAFAASTSVTSAAFFYAIAVSSIHGVSVLAFSQAASCAEVLVCGYSGDRYEQVGSGVDAQDDVEDTFGQRNEDTLSQPNHLLGQPTRPNQNVDHGLLFGVNGALALVVLVITQLAVDVSGVNVFGAAGSAGAVSALAAVFVWTGSAYRRMKMHTDWGLSPTPADMPWAQAS
tara:strand:+ start:8570 stop:10063 length:1494 start_codon:yes stop_codon:yes gene_type:complete